MLSAPPHGVLTRCVDTAIAASGVDRAASWQLGVQNGHSLKGRDVAEPLIGADEVIERGHSLGTSPLG